MYLRTHSSKRKRKRSTIVIIVLLFLFVVGCALYFFFSEQLIFTKDGFRFSFTSEQKPPTTDDVTPPPIIIDDSGTPPPVAPVTPPDVDVPTPMSITNALTIPTNKLSDLAYIDTLLAQGVTDVAFFAKGDDGVLNIGGTYTAEVGSGALSPVWAENEAGLKKLRDADVKLTAIISVLRDNKMPRTNKEHAIKTNGVTWLDYYSFSWFDPKGDFAVTYTNEIIDQCKTLGVSQVVLQHMSYPTRGKLHLVSDEYKPDAVTLEAFAKRFVRDDIAISIWLSDTQYATQSAQSVASFGSIFKLLYIDALPESEASNAVKSQLLTDTALGYIVPDSTVIAAPDVTNYIIK